MAADGTSIKSDIDNDLAGKGYRGIRIATLIATLKKVVDWVSAAINSNIGTWYKPGTTSPAANAEDAYHQGRLIVGRTTDDGTGSSLQVEGFTRTHGLVAAGGLPTFAVGAGLGAGATAQVLDGSTDLAGSIRLVTGSSGLSGNASVGVLSFSKNLDAAPRFAFLSPRNQAAAREAGKLYVDGMGANGVALFGAGGDALTANATYVFNYFIVK